MKINVEKTSPFRIHRISVITQFFLPMLALATLLAATHSRNIVWQNEMSFWEDAAMKSPGKGRVHHNLGRAYDTSRLPRKAFEQYLIAVTVEPDLAKAHESLGISYTSMGKFDIARYELEIALRLDPKLQQARMFLGYIAMQDKRNAI
jgi:lipoprotein NlpI